MEIYDKYDIYEAGKDFTSEGVKFIKYALLEHYAGIMCGNFDLPEIQEVMDRYQVDFLSPKKQKFEPDTLEERNVRNIGEIVLLAKCEKDADKCRQTTSQKMMATEEGRAKVVSILKSLVAFGESDLVKRVLEYKAYDKYDPVGYMLFFSEQREELMNNVVNKLPEEIANYLKSATFSNYDDFGDKITTYQLLGHKSIRM
ncbi:hypothetical protein M9Y10_019025 [Tritrichomonas musculus]|uniref:Uncharacterized protein n=1 Tax=Tritrichomonas musculus TaxID=1915356 RepID=A0ABR2HJJ0_9EUKA